MGEWRFWVRGVERGVGSGWGAVVWDGYGNV